MSDTLLTYYQAAKLLNMTPGALRAAVARRAIPHVRLGPRHVRFDPDELRRWLDSCRVPAQGGTQR